MIRQLVLLTYLRPKNPPLSSDILDETEFEISPIIKSKVDVNFMNEMLLRMKTITEKSEEKELFEEEK